MLVLTTSSAQGLVQDRPGEPAPELVLLARGEPGHERVFAIAAPDVFGGGPVFPWAVPFEAEPFADGEVVRAHGFWLRTRGTCPLAGGGHWRGGRFVPVLEAAK
jgi:hypothetical protein